MKTAIKPNMAERNRPSLWYVMGCPLMVVKGSSFMCISSSVVLHFGQPIFAALVLSPRVRGSFRFARVLQSFRCASSALRLVCGSIGSSNASSVVTTRSSGIHPLLIEDHPTKVIQLRAVRRWFYSRGEGIMRGGAQGVVPVNAHSDPGSTLCFQHS